MKNDNSLAKNAHLFILAFAFTLFCIGYATSYKAVFESNAHAWLDYTPGGEQYAMGPDHEDMTYAKKDNAPDTKTDNVVNISTSDVDWLSGLRLQIGE